MCHGSVSAPVPALMAQVSAFCTSAGPSGLRRLGKSVSPFFSALDSGVVISLEMSMCFLEKKKEKARRGKKFNLFAWRKYKLQLTLPFPLQPPSEIGRVTSVFGEWRML